MALREVRLKIKDFDWILVLLSILLLAFSVVVIFSTTSGQAGLLPKNALAQAIFGLIGIFLMMAFALGDYRFFKNFSLIFYLITISLLVAVLIFGTGVRGVSRWLPLGFFNFQPSELAKLVLIFILAYYFSEKTKEGHPLIHILISFLIVAVPVFLVARQPDLGTALVLVAIWLGMLISSSLDKIYLFIVGTAGLALLPLFWHFLKDYQKTRIITFLNPQADPLGAGYHILQSIIAVGSGGLWGRGLGHGPQSQLKYLPFVHTDFIFAALAEEWGFIGASLLLVLFFVLIFRILRISRLAQDEFGMLLTSGILVMILFQILVNIGMNIGLLPITGIPLPFISYGGSSLLVNFIALGILESIILRHRKISF